MSEEIKSAFRERLADLMVEHGPDRHCDGHEIIADLLWAEFVVAARNAREFELEAIVREIAAIKDCEEEPEKCISGSGPCCERHGDNYAHRELIDRARRAIAPE